MEKNIMFHIYSMNILFKLNPDLSSLVSLEGCGYGWLCKNYTLNVNASC